MFLTILCFLSEALEKAVNVVWKKEKTFPYYLGLPELLRKTMINKMQARDRCAFAGTSKLCYKEAKACNHYMYKIALEELPQKVRISVIFSKKFTEFLNMEFYNSRSNKRVKIFSNFYWMKNEVPLNEEKYDDSMDMVEYSVEHFKQLLKFYKKAIRSLRITGPVFREKLGNFDFLIDLYNLEEVTIDSIYVDQFLPNLQSPLKKLKVHGRIENDDDLANIEECKLWAEIAALEVSNEQQEVDQRPKNLSNDIYQVQDSLICRYTCFNYGQLTRLTTKNAEINIERLAMHSIYNFIRGWQNGSIGQQIEKYTWFGGRGVNFPHEELFRRFEARSRPFFMLRSFVNPEKIAVITYQIATGQLVFEMDDGSHEIIEQ